MSQQVLTHQLTGLVPMAHVTDVRASADFYSKLGLEVLGKMGPAEEPFWANLGNGQAQIMFTRAGGRIQPRDQAILFYLYTTDLVALRQSLVESGVADGGAYCGESEGEFPRSGMLFDISTPHYMPRGEMRVHDPDGYVLLIGQAEPE